MSNRYHSRWGDHSYHQTVGFDGNAYYVRSQDHLFYIGADEIDDLIYQLMRLKRKVEGE